MLDGSSEPKPASFAQAAYCSCINWELKFAIIWMIGQTFLCHKPAYPKRTFIDRTAFVDCERLQRMTTGGFLFFCGHRFCQFALF